MFESLKAKFKVQPYTEEPKTEDILSSPPLPPSTSGNGRIFDTPSYASAMQRTYVQMEELNKLIELQKKNYGRGPR